MSVPSQAGSAVSPSTSPHVSGFVSTAHSVTPFLTPRSQTSHGSERVGCCTGDRLVGDSAQALRRARSCRDAGSGSIGVPAGALKLGHFAARRWVTRDTVGDPGGMAELFVGGEELRGGSEGS